METYDGPSGSGTSGNQGNKPNLISVPFWYRSHTETTYSVNDSILVLMFWFRLWYRYVPVQLNKFELIMAMNTLKLFMFY